MKTNFSLFIFTCLTPLLLTNCGGNEDEEQEAPPSYPVVEVTKRNITNYRTFPARIEGTANVEVRPKISGFLEQIYVDEGQWVKKGDRLFKLEARSLRGEVDAAASQINVAQANVADSQIEVNKLVPLVQDTIISPVQLESARAKLSAAESELARARNTYKSLQENINYQFVTSSVDGVVGRIPYRQGTLVSAEQETPLTVVSEVDSVFVYFSMNEKEYLEFLKETENNTLPEKIDNFQEVLLELADGSEYSEKGRIQTNTGQLDPETGTITFRAIFKNRDNLLSSGSSGMVKIPKELNDVLLVPAEATFEEQARRYVFVLAAGDTIVRTRIISEVQVDNLVVVQEGLKEADKVVAGGVNQAQNKTRIEPQVVPFDSMAKGVKQVFR